MKNRCPVCKREVKRELFDRQVIASHSPAITSRLERKLEWLRAMASTGIAPLSIHEELEALEIAMARMSVSVCPGSWQSWAITNPLVVMS